MERKARSTRCRSLLLVVSLAGMANACLSTTTPHQNYLNYLHAWVGGDIRKHGLLHRFERTVLPNSNYEYRWTRRMTSNEPCTDIFEVDPATFKVINARFI